MSDTAITVTTGSAILPAVAGKPLSSVSSYQVSDSNKTFIAEQNIGIHATGLRPSTKIFVFFDGYRVSDLATPATLDFTIANPAVTDYSAAGVRGSDTYTDANGNFAAILYIPPGTFYTGDRQVVIADVDNLNSLAAATTSASYTYHAFDHSAVSSDALGVVSTRPSIPSIPPTAPPSSSQPNSYPPDYASLTQAQINAIYANDPLAQAFYVGSDDLSGADGIFVTSIDLYFESKDSVQGVTIDIRTMNDGTPTKTVIPHSTTFIPPASINISNDSSVVTNIAFSAPVYLAKDNFYAVCITPSGNNPNYRVYSAAVGDVDLITSNPIYKNWGSGDLFTSTNSSTWVPIPNEFLKFTLYRANFISSSNSSSSVSLVNDDYEYFFYSPNSYGTFQQGEYAFKLAANMTFSNSSASTSNVYINANTYTVTIPSLSGTLTSGLTQFSNSSILIASNGSANDVLLVSSVANSTAMTIKNVPGLSGNVSIQWTPVGIVDVFDYNSTSLSLKASTAANASFLFSNNSVVYGVTSGAMATISVVRDRIISRFAPFFNTVSFPTTNIDLQMKNTLYGTYGNTSSQSYSTSKINYILDNEVAVSSKSSEIVNLAGAKSLSANIVMNSNSNYISPAIDLTSSSLVAFRNLINNSTTGENTKTGQAINKYISKTITLASGLDSEDLVVYLDAYYPQGTNISVYAKLLSASDPDPFDTKDWTLLSQVTPVSTYSDAINLSDIKEFKFEIPTSPPSTIKTGILTTNTANATVTGINTSFTTDVSIGDLVKIYSDSTKTTFQISKVTSIDNNTSITVDNNSAFTSSSASYERVTLPHTAYLNNQNGNIVRYYSNTGVAYDTFITYAIKIDLTSPYTYRVPRVLNLRAIAVT
jgi:hypothetical protein